MENPNIKVIITGVTGMVGEGVLHEALHSPYISEVLVITRRPTQQKHPKLKEYQLTDFMKPKAMAQVIEGYDACFFCLGVSSLGMKEAKYTSNTYDLTMGFAKVLFQKNPNMIFSYISGQSTDSTEKGKLMWARVKGKTENDLQKIGFKEVIAFRPGLLKPTPGLKNTLFFYKYIGWLYPLLTILLRNSVSTLKELGDAMIESAVFGSSKTTIEVKDILTLAKQLSHRQ